MVMGFGSVAKKVVATKIVAADGSGDFTDIATAVAALPAAGGVVYIKEGTYTLTASIIIDKDNVSIIGAGFCTKIVTTSNIAMISASEVDHIFLDKFYLYGDTTEANNIGIYFDDVSGATCRDLYIEKCGSHGISGVGGTYNLISGCVIYDCEGDNIHLDGTVTAGGVWTIAESLISTSSLNGIYTNDISQIIISDTECSFNVNYGIYAQDSSSLIIGKCNVLANGYDGIKLVGYTSGIINGNFSKYNDDADVGNYSGIFLDASDNISITNNNCLGNSDYGINISNVTCDNTIVMGNNCRGNDVGQINDAGTNTLPNGVLGTTNLQLDDLNIIA